jgi:hypothetical protein
MLVESFAKDVMRVEYETKPVRDDALVGVVQASVPDRGDRDRDSLAEHRASEMM